MIDGFDIAQQITKLAKEYPYGKLSVSYTTHDKDIVQCEVLITNKVLVKNNNPMLILYNEIFGIINEENKGKVVAEFLFKDKAIYKIIFKYVVKLA